VDMPGGDGLMGFNLVQAVKNRMITEERIDDMIIRLLTPYYLFGQDQEYPSLNLDRNVIEDHYKINQEIATAGIILLKNTNNILPFDVTKDKYYFIYGSVADQSNKDFDSRDSAKHSGALYQGGGSGFVQPTYAIDPLTSLLIKGQDFHFRIRYITNQNDYVAINNSFNGRGFAAAKCLVFISAWSSEGYDRNDLHALNNGDKLVQTVASRCANTIVIV
ncbi:unnamed protein product, partial [Rotaria sordida]